MFQFCRKSKLSSAPSSSGVATLLASTGAGRRLPTPWRWHGHKAATSSFTHGFHNYVSISATQRKRLPFDKNVADKSRWRKSLRQAVRKSQITHSDMHHPVSGINFLIHSVSLASHVSTHLLIQLSSHLCHHHHSHHPSLLHCFTPGSKPTFSTNPSHLRFLLPNGLPSWQRDLTGPIMHIFFFIFSFTF